jgi:Leucine-rich repeat (LRR) protein
MQVDYRSEHVWRDITENVSILEPTDYAWHLRGILNTAIQIGIRRDIREQEGSEAPTNNNTRRNDLDYLFRARTQAGILSVQEGLQKLLIYVSDAVKGSSPVNSLYQFEHILDAGLKHARVRPLMAMLCAESQLNPQQVFRKLLVYCQNSLHIDIGYGGLEKLILLSSALIQVFRVSPNLHTLSLSNQEIETDEYVVETGEYLKLMDYPLNRSDYTMKECGVEQVFEELLKHCPLLQSLDLSFTSWVTNPVLKIILTRGIHLNTLILVGCKGLPTDLDKRFEGTEFAEMRSRVLNTMQ